MVTSKLLDLQPPEYEHPFDRKALEIVKGTPGLDIVVRKLNQLTIEKILKIQFTGSNLKVTRESFPEIHKALAMACNILQVSELPDLYIQWDYAINAFTAGVEKPIIVLSSGCLDLLTFEEQLYVIGHELGHIKSQHVLYHQIAQVFPVLGNLIGGATLGMGSLFATSFELVLLNWGRMSEFTADRAGLLVCQDVNVATKSLLKIAGLPQKYFDSIVVENFVKQAKEFDGYDFDTLDKITKVMSTLWKSHPWTVLRAAELFKWVESGEYESILSRHK